MKTIHLVWGLIGSMISATLMATPTLTLTAPTLNPTYQAGTTTTISYTINNYVPKALAVTSISGITAPLSLASNGCVTIPAASSTVPGQCIISINVAPMSSEVGETISQTLLIDVGSRTPLTSPISFKVMISHPIVFMTVTTTPGDMSAGGSTGLSSADAICNHDAQTYGTSAVKLLTYKALLIASSRSPCTGTPLNNGCGAGYQTSDWPIQPNTFYYNPDGSLFSESTMNAIFPDNPVPAFQTPSGAAAPDVYFWLGGLTVI